MGAIIEAERRTVGQDPADAHAFVNQAVINFKNFAAFHDSLLRLGSDQELTSAEQEFDLKNIGKWRDYLPHLPWSYQQAVLR